MCCRERGSRWESGQDLPQRQHGLDAFAGREDIGNDAEAHTVAEQLTHGASRRCNWSFVGGRLIEPCPVGAGDGATKVGHGGDQRRPRIARGSSSSSGR
jgi:hypothetical protein